MLHPRISRSWEHEPCFVLATGPSLTNDVLTRVRMARITDKWRAISVNDAYKRAPWSDALYACDNNWWTIHGNCFEGPKWACHQALDGNNKTDLDKEIGLNLVHGKDGDTFSVDPSYIHHGCNSGFQAVNLALHFGCKYIVLVGFDMRLIDGEAHFFGKHPDPLGNGDDNTYRNFANQFATAAKSLPTDVTIVNATPNSAMTCFPMMGLNEAIQQYNRLYRDRSEPCAVAN